MRMPDGSSSNERRRSCSPRSTQPNGHIAAVMASDATSRTWPGIVSGTRRRPQHVGTRQPHFPPLRDGHRHASRPPARAGCSGHRRLTAADERNVSKAQRTWNVVDAPHSTFVRFGATEPTRCVRNDSRDTIRAVAADAFDDDRLTLVGLLLEASSGLTRSLERRLLEESGLSAQWFELLIRLARTPEHRLRMSDLALQTTLTAERPHARDRPARG